MFRVLWFSGFCFGRHTTTYIFRFWMQNIIEDSGVNAFQSRLHLISKKSD